MNVSGDGSYSSIESLRDRILSETFHRHADVQHVCIEITRPRALLHPASTQLIVSRSRESVGDYERLSINDLECRAIVGINPCEREEAQLVTFGVMLQRSPVSSTPFDFRTLSQRIYSVRLTSLAIYPLLTQLCRVFHNPNSSRWKPSHILLPRLL